MVRLFRNNPIENCRQFLEVSSDAAERLDSIFYGDASEAPNKALGITEDGLRTVSGYQILLLSRINRSKMVVMNSQNGCPSFLPSSTDQSERRMAPQGRDRFGTAFPIAFMLMILGPWV